MGEGGENRKKEKERELSIEEKRENGGEREGIPGRKKKGEGEKKTGR